MKKWTVTNVTTGTTWTFNTFEEANKLAEYRIIDHCATNGPYIDLPAIKQRFQMFFGSRFNFINFLRTLIITLTWMAFCVAMSKIRSH